MVVIDNLLSRNMYVLVMFLMLFKCCKGMLFIIILVNVGFWSIGLVIGVLINVGVMLLMWILFGVSFIVMVFVKFLIVCLFK